jgi:hypothetical protein
LARGKPDTYLTEKGTPLKDETFHTPLPKGPAGQFSYHVPFSNLVMGYSKNQKAAKDFLQGVGELQGSERRMKGKRADRAKAQATRLGTLLSEAGRRRAPVIIVRYAIAVAEEAQKSDPDLKPTWNRGNIGLISAMFCARGRDARYHRRLPLRPAAI